MSAKTREHIYNAICIFCIILCIILIGRVAADELTDGRGKEYIHHPPEVRHESNEERNIISEKNLSEELKRYLGGVLPIRDIAIDVSEGGKMLLTAKASREELTDYLKSYGIESGVAALMLPQVIDLEISVDCSYDDETGLVAIDPVGLRIGESDFSLAAFPAESFSAINNGLNKLLMASGYRLESIRFTEDGIILE